MIILNNSVGINGFYLASGPVDKDWRIQRKAWGWAKCKPWGVQMRRRKRAGRKNEISLCFWIFFVSYSRISLQPLLLICFICLTTDWNLKGPVPGSIYEGHLFPSQLSPWFISDQAFTNANYFDILASSLCYGRYKLIYSKISWDHVIFVCHVRLRSYLISFPDVIL